MKDPKNVDSIWAYKCIVYSSRNGNLVAYFFAVEDSKLELLITFVEET
jgi:hypothetical protein